MKYNLYENIDKQEKKLEILRELVNINPIDFIKVQRARKIDCSISNDLEFALRMKTLENIMFKDWKKYIKFENDGVSLTEYADDLLEQKLHENIMRR